MTPQDEVPASRSAARTKELPGEGATVSASPGASLRSPPVFHANDLVAGRFKIIDLIGQGGMGAVYEAEDLELGGRVALKTIHPETAGDPRAIERFKQEIYLARKVTHPNVCRIFDLFYHRTGSPESAVLFLTMELLRGETLAQRLRQRGRMSATEALPLVSQMAAALGAAHAAGIVHRDFKPSNVVLVPSREKADDVRAVVTDFGLARTSVEDHSVALAVTGTGDIVGTPAYMAPEQLTAEDITPATDIYSLGLVMYEMVAGQPPFAGDTPVGAAVQRLQRAPASPRALVPDLDPRWEATILRCLERHPADRFASAADVVSALGGNQVVRVPSVERRRKLRMVVMAAAIALLAGGLGFFTFRASRAPSRDSVVEAPVAAPVKARRSVAVLGFKNLSGRSDAAWLSTALSEMLTTELAAGERLRTIPGEEVVRMKIDLELADADSFGTDTLARIRTNLGTDLVVLGSYVALGEKAGEQLRVDLRVQDARVGETIASLTDTATEAEFLSLVSRTGSVLREKLGVGELSAAQVAGMSASLPSSPLAARLYTEGLAKLRLSENPAARDLLEKAIAAEPNYPLAHAALAAAWSALGYDANAKNAARRAFDLSEKLSREERLWIEGRYRQTTDEREKATDIYRTLFDFFPDNLEYGLRLAGAQTAAGKGKDALATVELLRRLPAPLHEDPRIDLAEAAAAESVSDFKRQEAAAARAAQKATAQGARILVARARLLEGEAFQSLGESAKAIARSEDAQRIFTAAGDRGGVARALNRIAIVRRQQGELAQALRLYDQVLATYREIGDRSGAATIANNIANVLRQQGRLPQAAKMYEESLAVGREIGDKRAAALALNNMAIVFRQQGNLARAKTTYEEALAIRREIGEKSGVAATLGNIANVLSDQGDFASAAKLYEEALAISREIGDRRVQALSLNNLAFVLWPRGEVSAARKLYEDSLAISREIGDKRGVARGLNNLADMLRSQGDLVEATKRYEEALAVFRDVGEKRGLAFAHAGLGDVLLAQGDLSTSRKHHEEALTIRQASNEKLSLPESHLALARLSIAQGRASEGERLAQQAIGAYRSQKAFDGEALAHAVLGRALLAQAKLREAERATARAAVLSRASQNRFVRLSVAGTEARVRAASGSRARLAEALEILKETLADVSKTGFVDLQFETRLMLGEAEVAAGDQAAGRARLATLEKDAAAKGFGLISRKAEAGRK